MKSIFKSAVVCGATVFFATGCAMVAPSYNTSMDNVQSLKNNSQTQLKVTPFTSEKSSDNHNTISIRGSSLASPYDQSYSAYLTTALKQELQMANRLSNDAAIEVTGTLLKNDIDAAGFSTGYTTVSARFIVKKDGKESYNQVKTVKHEFSSSFMGSIAIPSAVQSYNVAVQKLLASLFADNSFNQATK
ncbi:hypothetical protein [Undibacterium curvum]|uniref:Lipoprotein n=1 Tax=Undibacterium curvum TaxID=2762294 RepID=A0ABR7A1U4_9BURK|nr:hypothetical protein [Undibacterium curvum]MBC3930726.1 hypothetical protein [Undibacterium curvum]